MTWARGTELEILRKHPSYRHRRWLLPQRSRITMRLTSRNRHTAFAYLRAESLRLSADYGLLLREFEILVERPFEPSAHATWRRKSRQLRGLLANHRLAWQWTQHPPCGVDAPQLHCFRPVAVPPTDFLVTAIAAHCE
jgi:hypothetical protein